MSKPLGIKLIAFYLKECSNMPRKTINQLPKPRRKPGFWRKFKNKLISMVSKG